MKKYDHMKNMRLLFWKISVVPFCTVLVFLLFLFMGATGSTHHRGCIRLPDAEHAHLQPMPEYPAIYIKKDGTVYFLGNPVEDLDILPELVKKEFDEHISAGNKILVKASRHARFGRVQAVLREIKKMGVDVAGLITEGGFAALNFTKKK